jgi:hypothetical protein
MFLISFRWVKCLGVGMKPNLVLNEDEKKVSFYKLHYCLYSTKKIHPMRCILFIFHN